MIDANMFISGTRARRGGLRRLHEVCSCTIPGMENARDNIAPAEQPMPGVAKACEIAWKPAGGGEAREDGATVADSVRSDGAKLDAPEAQPEYRELLSDERRREMHASFNNRISYLCKLAALVIAIVAFATIALGQELLEFVLMGLCLSVALLALAMLQDHHQRRR